MGDILLSLIKSDIAGDDRGYNMAGIVTDVLPTHNSKKRIHSWQGVGVEFHVVKWI